MGIPEISWFSKLTKLDQQRESAQSTIAADPTLPGRLGRYGSNFWWMDPAAAFSMAKAQIEPDSPTALAAAGAAAVIKPGGWNDITGRPVGKGELDGVMNGVDEVAPQFEATKNQDQQPPTDSFGQPVQSFAQALFGGVEKQGFLKYGTRWDSLSPDVKNELNQLQFTPVDPTSVPGYNPNNTQTTQTQAGYEIHGLDNLSGPAYDALQKVAMAAGSDMHRAGPWTYKRGTDLAAVGNTESRNLLVLGGTPMFASGPSDRPVGDVHAMGLPVPEQAISTAEKGVQIGGMAMQAPWQELQGQFRNLYQLAVNHENPQWTESQSDLGIAVGEGLRGTLQQGAFGDSLLGAAPGSQVVQERQARERERGVIGTGSDAMSITPGRALAAGLNGITEDLTGHSVIEPGSLQFNLLSGITDAALMNKYDPTARVLQHVGGIEQGRGTIGESSISKAIDAFHSDNKVSEALTAFQKAGGIMGLRRTVDQNAANHFLDSVHGQQMVSTLTKLDDGPSIYKYFNGQISPELADTIGGLKDPGNIRLALGRELGSRITQAPEFQSIPDRLNPLNMFNDGPAIVQAKPPNRWAAMMPAHAIFDAMNKSNSVKELERASSLLGTSPDLYREAWTDIARANVPHDVEAAFQKVMKDAQDRVWGKLTANINPNDKFAMAEASQRARALATMRQDPTWLERLYATRAVQYGQGTMGQQLTLNGKVEPIKENEPQFLAQTTNGYIGMPDWRELRRALSDHSVVFDNKGVKAAEWVADSAQQVWKGLQIMTVKTMIKVLGDEQFAMAGRGYDSLINHPLHALGIIMSTPMGELPPDEQFLNRVASTLGKLTGDAYSPNDIGAPAGVGKVIGGAIKSGRHEALSEVRSVLKAGSRVFPSLEPHLTSFPMGQTMRDINEMKAFLPMGWETELDTKGVITADDWKALIHMPGVNDRAFYAAHAGYIGQMAADDTMRGFVRAGSLADAQQSYWDGELSQFRKVFAKTEKRTELLNRAGSDAYVQKQLDQIQYVTGAHPDLMDAIRTGKLGNVPIHLPRSDGSPLINKTFIRKLTNEYGDSLPNVTIAQKQLSGYDPMRAKILDGTFGRMIHLLLSEPSNTLSKSPLFRQAYWERMIDNVSFMSPEARAEFDAAAQATNLTPKLQRALDAAAPSTGTLDMRKADDIAKSYGLDMVRRTTHDFSQRSQMFDMLRILAPFGDVWRKTLQRWANIIKENPQVLRRLQAGLVEAQSPGLGETMAQLGGHEAPTTLNDQGVPVKQGFFHTDQFGQEVFSIPGSEFATQAATGVPIPLVGDVKGLTLGTEFMPGLGPIMSLPVAYTMQHLHIENTQTPLGTFKELLFPHGSPDPAAATDLWNYAPSWMRTALAKDRVTSPDDVRVFNNSIKSLISYGISLPDSDPGHYDVSTNEGIQHAVEDATDKAHRLFNIRGLAQFVVPGAPSAQMVAKDKDGNLIDLTLVINEYNKLQAQQNNGQIADAGKEFLDRFGPNLFKAATSKSYASVFGVPTDVAGAKWVDDHSSIRTDLPHIFGYFAPRNEDPNAFDYETYLKQFSDDQRSDLSPAQWVKASNARLAQIIYGGQRDKMEQASGGKPNDAQRAWLRGVKLKLMDQYPGFADAIYGGTGFPSRAQPTELIDEAKKAVTDKVVLSTPQGQALNTYMQQRQRADDAWTSDGHSSGSWGTSTGAQAINLRAWLRGVAVKIEAQHPEFHDLYENVLDREMVDDSARVSVGG